MARRIRDYVHYGCQLVSGFRARHEINFARMRQKDISGYLTATGLRILDLANGNLRPQYTLLKAADHKVCGIDLVNRPRHNLVNAAYVIARWLYTRKLGILVKNRAETLVCGDVARLPFSDNRFDLVTSIAAFEHFYHVPTVVAEMFRVLRPNGLAWVCVHLFSSPSGAHNISLTEIPLRTIPSGIDAWDHLRKQRLSFTVPLNKWRKEQYLAEFRKHFDILKEYCALREGEHLLTLEIEKELSDYSRDELTCGAYVIVAKKPLL